MPKVDTLLIPQSSPVFSKPSVAKALVTTTAFDWHYPTSTPAYSIRPNDFHLGFRLSDNAPIEGRPDGEYDDDVLLADPELKKPQPYAVVMYNDDYTPMEFVVAVLQTHFKHGLDDATGIMLAIHHEGKGIAGVYPKDIAETKAQIVNREARLAGFPLLTQIEPQPTA
ncbi:MULTISPECIES: ATP-dependent Clp protease adaptor ClpS [unclassified Moraxella]|uniref:ATP-dependent Clp protease adaptor ClpS n=1 Tax=unclassified Moraxella TaxID=2685852 RepID=UPI003AF5EE3A